MNALSKKSKIISWICRITGTIIMGQTLFFKFSAAPESIYIFTKVGMEPWGRWATGSVELIASLMLLWTPFSWLGSFLAVTVMFGAIFSHLTLLGIEVQGDHGELFTLACVVFTTALTNLYLVRSQIPFVGDLLASEKASETFAKFHPKNIRLGYLFLGVCVSIAFIGVVEEVYTISKIIGNGSTPVSPEIRSVAQIAYFLTILGVLASFFLAMALLRMVGKPISNFTKVCKEIILGNQGARVPLQSGVELGLMARSFNQMLDDLQAKDTNIRSLLAGISDAVFFFDKTGKLSQERSKATDVIFPELLELKSIGLFFQKYIGRRPEETQETLSLFWNPDITLDFQSIAALFPNSAELADPKAAHGKRFVSIKYRSEASLDGHLQRIIVIATDRTEEELASRESALQRENVTRLSLISASISDFQGSLDEINDIWEKIKAAVTDLNLNGKPIDEPTLKRHLHSLKGGLAAYEFKSLASKIHQVETQLSEKSVTEIAPQLKSELDLAEVEFRKKIGEIEQLFGLSEEKNWVRVSRSKLDRLELSVQEKNDKKLSGLLQSLYEQELTHLLTKYDKYLAMLSEKDGTKVVKLKISPESVEVLPESLTSLSNCLGHLLRNSFDHGIESLEDRTSSGKSEEGTILITASKPNPEVFQLSIRDDGRGIQTDRLAEAALKRGQWTPRQVSEASEAEKLELIFASGLSTQESISETSGRGVGMDAVRAELESRGGQIAVKTWPNQGTEFVITIPLTKGDT